MPQTSRCLRRRRFNHLAAAASLVASSAPALGQPAGSRPLTRIAFGSCADQNEPQPIWAAIEFYRPDLFIFMGDNVYAGLRAQDLAELRAAYAKGRQLGDYMAFVKKFPVQAIWDDHDYGVNDGGVENPFKQQAKDEFLRFWNIQDDDIRHTREGLYHSVSYGPAGMRLQIILLDTRWFRSPLRRTDSRGAPGRERYLPDDDPSKTMLGDRQWLWLRERLQEPADLRLIVSSVQVVADGHGWERWGNMPRERQKLYELIAQTRAKGVFFISGDRHIGAIYRETADTPYPLIDVTSSGLNKFYAAAKEDGPNRVGALYALPNFGTADIDWWERTLTLSIRDEGGQARRQLRVGIDALQAG